MICMDQISSSDRKSLAKQLEDTFDFSPGQLVIFLLSVTDIVMTFFASF